MTSAGAASAGRTRQEENSGDKWPAWHAALLDYRKSSIWKELVGFH